MGKLANYKHPIAITTAIILYSVGIYAFIHDWTSVILLTPFNLLISLALLLLTSHPIPIKLMYFVFVAWLAGFGVEVLGVNTGFPFGEYHYKHVLGTQLWNTPLIIGINWVLLLLGSRALIDQLYSGNKTLKSALAATLMVLLDILIEPIAITYDFWSWKGEVIPLSNYVAWWIIAFLLHVLQQKMLPVYTNLTAIALLLIQFMFFGILNVFLYC